MKAKEIIESGDLGIISNVSYRYCEPLKSHGRDALPWRYIAETAGGGLFFDLGSHALDIIDFMLGPLDEAAGIAVNRAAAYDVEDNVVMHFRSSSGWSGCASWNFVGFDREDRIEIVGTSGRLVLSVFGDEPVQSHTAVGLDEFDLPNPHHIQQPLIQTVVDALRGKGSCLSTGDSAARTAMVMDVVTESYYGTRDSGFWERPDRWPGRPI